MAVKAVAERTLQPVVRRFLLLVRCPSNRVMTVRGRYRLSGAEEVAGVIGGSLCLFESYLGSSHRGSGSRPANRRRISPVSCQNLIRAENGAIRFVPRIEKRTWTRSRVALRSAKVLFRRGPGHMRRSY